MDVTELVRGMQVQGRMTRPAMTADELSGLLGDVEATTIERILATGASIDEVGEALSELELEEAGEAPHAASTTRVVEVKRILEELVLAEREDEEASRDRA